MDSIWGDIPTWLGIAGGAVAFWLGRREYMDAQKWKRSEFLASEVDKFFAQPRVATALLLIDYSIIRLDAKGQRAPTASTDTYVLDDPLMTDALRVHKDFVNETEAFGPAAMLAREAFDDLLTGFERFAHHIQNGLIDLEDVKVYLEYWIDKFADPRSGWKPAAFYVAVSRFVEEYKYRGAAQLFADCGHPLTPGSQKRSQDQ